VQFKSQANNSVWWGPATTSVKPCVAQDASIEILKTLPTGYDAMLVVIQAQKNASGLWTYSNICSTNSGTNSSVTFAVTQGDCYQFLLCVMAPAPPKLKIGQPLEVTFPGGWW
jgi:hypothetical protein